MTDLTYEKIKEAVAAFEASESLQELPDSMLLLNESALEFLNVLGEKHGFSVGVEEGNLLLQLG